MKLIIKINDGCRLISAVCNFPLFFISLPQIYTLKIFTFDFQSEESKSILSRLLLGTYSHENLTHMKIITIDETVNMHLKLLKETLNMHLGTKIIELTFVIYFIYHMEPSVVYKTSFIIAIVEQIISHKKMN